MELFKKIFIFALFFLSAASVQAESIAWDCSVSPKNFFVGEDKAVIFGCRFFSEFSGSKVVVAEKNEEKKVKFFWELNDTAFLGDKKAGDGFWSRKVDFKERKEGKITFSFYFVPQDKEITASFLDETKPVHEDLITLSYRPSFIEILGQIWKKI